MSFSASAWRGLWWILCIGLAGGGFVLAGDDDSAVLEQARQAVAAGHFREAEALLGPRLGDPNAPVVNDFAVLREIMRRVRQDYSLTPEKMLTKLRESIPDVTREDVDRWRDDGMLQHRVIDGETWYFGREPSNLFRFDEQAKARRTPAVKSAGEFELPAHVARLLETAKMAGEPLVGSVKHKIRYEIRVHDGDARLHPGAKVRCWLPFPQEYRQQRDVRLIATDPPGGTVAPNGCPQRTVYFEQTLDEAAKPPHFVAEFDYVCSAYVPDLDPNAVRPYDLKSANYVENTAERPPHVVFTPEMRATAQEIVGDEQNPLLKAQRIFRWLAQNVKYCSEMEYSTIPNISAKALRSRRGDCGVQALLFITLCRAAGVPARWQSGWETLPGGWNMHDWAEFYVEPWGWLPADPSYGLQEHVDPRAQEFYCGHLDAYRMIVNLDYGRELDPPKISFRSEPTDFQRGEIEIRRTQPVLR